MCKLVEQRRAGHTPAAAGLAADIADYKQAGLVQVERNMVET